MAIDKANDLVVAGKITDAVYSGVFAAFKFSGIDGTPLWSWTTTEPEEAFAITTDSDLVVLPAVPRIPVSRSSNSTRWET